MPRSRSRPAKASCSCWALRTHSTSSKSSSDRFAEPVSVRFHVMAPDDFLLAPLPNHLFTRDTSAWVYDGVAINAMRWPARQRESVHFEAVYGHHPLFAAERAGAFHIWSEGEGAHPSTIEGGDVLVIGNGAVLVGMSERTTPQAVEPGVVVTYERNVTANTHLRENGIEVLEIPGSELGRGRGGPRCMSCPVERDAVP